MILILSEPVPSGFVQRHECGSPLPDAFGRRREAPEEGEPEALLDLAAPPHARFE